MSKQTVYNGIDTIENHLALFKDKRVGLITNPTGYTKDFISTVDTLAKLVQLTLLFAPEHGLRGEMQAGEQVDDYIDKQTGVKVISLYGDKKAPTQSEMEAVDIIIYDIQDIGSRYYTYIYTLFLSMQSAAKAKKPFVVLDRIHPFASHEVEGTILDEKISSFVGMLPLPHAYGLTCGELALYINDKMQIDCTLEIIPIVGWENRVDIEATDIPWIAPSPNIPEVETAILYPGTCLFEGTNLSEGRGTTKPFKQFGAPWLDNYQVVARLQELSFPGVAFRPVFFTPTFSKHAGRLCAGIEIHVIDQHSIRAWQMITTILQVIAELYPSELDTSFVSKDLGSETFMTYLSGYQDYREISLEWLKNQEKSDKIAFKEATQNYILYK